MSFLLAHIKESCDFRARPGNHFVEKHAHAMSRVFFLPFSSMAQGAHINYVDRHESNDVCLSQYVNAVRISEGQRKEHFLMLHRILDRGNMGICQTLDTSLII